MYKLYIVQCTKIAVINKHTIICYMNIVCVHQTIPDFITRFKYRHTSFEGFNYTSKINYKYFVLPGGIDYNLSKSDHKCGP